MPYSLTNNIALIGGIDVGGNCGADQISDSISIMRRLFLLIFSLLLGLPAVVKRHGLQPPPTGSYRRTGRLPPITIPIRAPIPIDH